MSNPVMKAVVDVTQSPMNAKRWVLDLECGHEVWLTADRKPTRKRVLCSQNHKHDEAKP